MQTQCLLHMIKRRLGPTQVPGDPCATTSPQRGNLPLLLLSFLRKNKTERATGTGNTDCNFLISRWNSLCHMDGLQNVWWSRQWRNGNLWNRPLKLCEDVFKCPEGGLHGAWEVKQSLQGRMKHPDPGPHPEWPVWVLLTMNSTVELREGGEKRHTLGHSNAQSPKAIWSTDLPMHWSQVLRVVASCYPLGTGFSPSCVCMPWTPKSLTQMGQDLHRAVLHTSTHCTLWILIFSRGSGDET